MSSGRRSVSVVLSLLVLGACGACGDRGPGGDGERGEREIRVGFLLPAREARARAASALEGARLGAEEAGRAGELIGRPFRLDTAPVSEPREAERALRRMAARGAVAVIGGFDEATCARLAAAAEREEILYLNVGCRANGLRDTRTPNVFHIEASDSMYRAAAAGPAVLWRADLSRYGAAQLNERAERRFGRGLDGPGWASWMAVKVLWESVLRSRSTDPATLREFLRSDSAVFDGHKGEPLRFAAGGQLLQPLHLAGAGERGQGSGHGTAGSGAAANGEARAGPSADAANGESRVGSSADAANGESRVGSSADPAPGSARVEGGGSRPAPGTLLLISNEGSEDVLLLDPATGRSLATIPVGSRPRGIHASPDGRRAYVALSDEAAQAEGKGDAIAVIDLASRRVVARHPAGTDPEQFGLSPDGRTLYASNEDAGTASIVDLASGRVLATLVVGIEPEGVAVSPDGRWVYVTAETSNTVSVIDTRSNDVVANFLVDVRPRAAAFSPRGDRAYVTNEISATVSVVDVPRHEVVATVELTAPDARPVGVAVSPDGRWVYVANGRAHSVSVIDAGRLEVVANIPVGRRPWGIALSPDGRHAYTANGGSDDISVIDVVALEVVATLPSRERPWGVAVASRPSSR